MFNLTFTITSNDHDDGNGQLQRSGYHKTIMHFNAANTIWYCVTTKGIPLSFTWICICVNDRFSQELPIATLNLWLNKFNYSIESEPRRWYGTRSVMFKMWLHYLCAMPAMVDEKSPVCCHLATDNHIWCVWVSLLVNFFFSSPGFLFLFWS